MAGQGRRRRGMTLAWVGETFALLLQQTPSLQAVRRDKFMNGLIVNLPVCRLVVYMVGTRNNHIGPVKIHPSTNYRDLPDTPRVFDVWRA